MALLDRQAREIPYDDSEPVLRQDPEHPNRWTYSSPAVPRVRAQVEAGLRGIYGWTITAEGPTPAQVLALIREMDTALHLEYGAAR